MKNWLTVALLSAVLTAVCEAETEQERPPPLTIAVAYFKALMEGEAESVNAVVAAPFSFDRKEILRTKEEVEKKHQQILAKKGKRKVPEYTVSVPQDAPKLDRKVFPEYEVFRINIAGEHVDIYISKGRVIGFSD